MALCEDDFDCPNNQLCYSGVSWFSVDDFPGSGGCLCNTWYGWEGEPECTTLSVYSFLLGAMNVFTIILGLMTTAVGALAASYLRSQGKRLVCTGNVTAQTISLTILSAFSASLWALVVCISTLKTSGEPIVPYEQYRDIYKGRGNLLSNIFAPLATFGAALAMLNISLVWIELSVKSGSLTRENRNRLTRSKKLVRGFQVAAVILASCGAVVEKTKRIVVMGFFISPLVAVIIMTYIVGAYKLTGVINRAAAANSETMDIEAPGESSNTTAASGSRSVLFLRSASTGSVTKRNFSEAHLRALRRIRKTSLQVSGSLFLFWVPYLTLSAVDAAGGFKEFSKPDEFPGIKAVHNFLMFSVVVGDVVVTNYVLNSLRAGAAASD